MSNIVIKVENLSKAYRLGQIGTGTLTNDLKVWWHTKMLHRPNPMLKIGQVDQGNQVGETIWALKDVSFDVQQGEVLGIIGRNGAGKSTLLKILSRVTAPTSGCVKVKGRIASLLEVGTGFHPELTGRENIYLNGAILGMTREEVKRKFNEIVAFAEIEKFVDTPVKRYSSGMYVRLAFAVAAHLESEILLVDEVLAVGDAEFQKKCLGKMGDVASKEGRTVLFVSHNMAAIMMLCPQSILIKCGEISFFGQTPIVINEYINSTKEVESNSISIASFYNTEVAYSSESLKSEFIFNTKIKINTTLSKYKLFLIIQNENSNILVHSVKTEKELSGLVKGIYQIKVRFPPLYLKPGNYSFHFKLVIDLGGKVRVLSSPIPIMINYFIDNENMQGLLNPEATWDIA